jgi:LCP family protein required for cell wall assembly
MRNPFRKKKSDGVGIASYSGIVRSVATRDHRRFAWLRHRWIWFVAAVVVLLGGIAGYAVWYYYDLQGDVQVRIPPVQEEPDEARPFNVLLVGSDSRRGLTEEEQQRLGADDVDPTTGEPISGSRADTLIFAHIDPETSKVTMVQFPRDLYVPLSTGGKNKINSALLEGRASLVETVEDITGLEINNYAEVNIAGFRDLVNAIDGVDVCVPEPIPFDKQTGLEVTPDEVGMVHFNGDDALRFVRSRKVFTEGEAIGDFARIQNQQMFLAAAISKVTSPKTILNFGKLRAIKDVGGRNLRIDDHTNLVELYRLLKRFRAFDPANYEAYTAPDVGFAENEAGSVVLPDDATMDAMFDAIANNGSPADMSNVPRGVDPAEIRVGVYNGLNHDKVVARPAREELESATELEGAGVDVVETLNAPREGLRDTVIRYERANLRMAEFIAAALPGAELKEGDTPLGIDVQVIVGKHFETQRVLRIEPIDLPVPGDLPEVCRD